MISATSKAFAIPLPIRAGVLSRYALTIKNRAGIWNGDTLEPKNVFRRRARRGRNPAHICGRARSVRLPQRRPAEKFLTDGARREAKLMLIPR